MYLYYYYFLLLLLSLAFLFFTIFWGRARWYPQQWTVLKLKHSNIKHIMLIRNKTPQATAAGMGGSKESNSKPNPYPALRNQWIHRPNEKKTQDPNPQEHFLNNIYKVDAQCWSKVQLLGVPPTGWGSRALGPRPPGSRSGTGSWSWSDACVGPWSGFGGSGVEREEEGFWVGDDEAIYTEHNAVVTPLTPSDEGVYKLWANNCVWFFIIKTFPTFTLNNYGCGSIEKVNVCVWISGGW